MGHGTWDMGHGTYIGHVTCDIEHTLTLGSFMSFEKLWVVGAFGL